MEADTMRRLTLALGLLAVLLTCFGCDLFRDRSYSKLVSLQSQGSGLIDIPLTPTLRYGSVLTTGNTTDVNTMTIVVTRTS
jgi:hypothetical protein